MRVRRRIANGIFGAFCALSLLLALLLLGLVLWTLTLNGAGGLTHRLFAADQPAPGSPGGLRNAIWGSAITLGVGIVSALVVGVLAGTWIAEFGRGTRRAAFVRFLNDVLLSAPSILIGLFVYQIVVAPLHGFSGLAGAVALALVAAPIVIRATIDMLETQPPALREAGLALGVGRSRVVRHILWRTGKTGLVTGALLAFARISGETAPLLFTSLGNQFLVLDPRQPMATLPTTILQFALSPYPDWRGLAWTGALLIVIAVLAVTISGRLLAERGRER